jgi:hypothetical protein
VCVCAGVYVCAREHACQTVLPLCAVPAIVHKYMCVCVCVCVRELRL